MPVKLTKEDLISKLQQSHDPIRPGLPTQVSQGAGFVKDTAGMGAAVFDGTERDFLERVEKSMGHFQRILDSLANLKDNPIIQEVVARYLAKKLPPGFTNQGGEQPQYQIQGPGGIGENRLDVKEASKIPIKRGRTTMTPKDVTEQIINALKQTKEHFGDIQISKILELLEENKKTFAKAVELRQKKDQKAKK